jgi:hypothetical protein
MVMLGLILCVISGMLWIFKDGYIAKPLVLLLFGIVLLFIRSVFSQVEDFCNGSSLYQIAAIESYILVGASFLISSELNAIFESVKEAEE